MKTISENTRAKIRESIKKEEQKTDGEIVCVITQRSANYVLYPIITAALLSLMLPLIDVLGSLIGHDNTLITFEMQSLSFLVLVTAFTLTPLKLLITPNAVIIGQCKRYALENFFALKVHETENRSGVMIFVSLNERRIDIIADKGIDDKVNPDEWQNTLNALIEKIKSNEVERGFIDAITSTGALLESHFPAKKKNINERPNHLIELKKSCYIR